MATKKATKTPRRPDVKTNIGLSAEAHKRLFLTALMSGQTASSIVERLITEHCREWSMPGKIAARGQSPDSASRDDQREESLQDAA